MRRGDVRCALAAVLAAALGACRVLEPRPDRTRFFVLATPRELASTSRPSDAAEFPPAVPLSLSALGLGPVTLPDYARRGELVRRRRAVEIDPAHDERWGEPIDVAVVRVMSDALTRELGVRVQPYPWVVTQAPELQVRLGITSFEGRGDRIAFVEARWELLRTATDEVLVAGTGRYETPLDSADGGALARGLSLGLAELSSELADVVRANATAP